MESLKNKVIKFNSLVEQDEVMFDEGMMGRVVDEDATYEKDVCELVVDFSEFIEHNRKLMKSNFYDENGIACLTWEQSRFFPKNHKDTIYIMTDFEKYPPCFDVVKTDTSFDTWFNTRHAAMNDANTTGALKEAIREMCKEAFEAGFNSK